MLFCPTIHPASFRAEPARTPFFWLLQLKPPPCQELRIDEVELDRHTLPKVVLALAYGEGDSLPERDRSITSPVVSRPSLSVYRGDGPHRTGQGDPSGDGTASPSGPYHTKVRAIITTVTSHRHIPGHDTQRIRTAAPRPSEAEALSVHGGGCARRPLDGRVRHRPVLAALRPLVARRCTFDSAPIACAARE